jgi:Fic family protein
MLDGIVQTAQSTISLLKGIKTLMQNCKHQRRTELPKIYRQELLNNLFRHPYTKIEFIIDDLDVSRITATNYLEQLVEHGFLHKEKFRRTNYYINQPLCHLLIEHS